MFKKTIVIFLFCLPVSLLMAQNELKIESIFEKYGKQQGSVLIELSTDVLGKDTRMTRYKSLIMPLSEEVSKLALEAIKEDIEGGSKLVETLKDGQVETGYYCLKKTDSKTYDYILFKNKSKKINLIYIRGNFQPQSLELELDKLKDLFIYVNKKRLKLQ